MNTILLFGNETTEGKSLVDLLKQWDNSLHVMTAVEEKEVINILSDQSINIIICNLNLTDRHNLSALLRITSTFPFVPCITITNFVTEAIRHGAIFCLQSPLDTSAFLSQVAGLLEVDTRGTIKGIPIHSFLQMLEGEEKTCTLAVSTTSETGLLYIKNGTLIGAETTELKGEKAVYEILVWEDAVIEIKFLNPRRKQDIDKALIYLIMEAFRLKDEESEANGETNTNSPRVTLQHISTIGNPLPLEIGAQLKIDFEKDKRALVSTMVGMIPDHTLIVTTPSPTAVVKKALDRQERITVKYIQMGRLCMFKAKLIKAIDHPQKLLFLDYPTVIHCREMRRSERIATAIPCKLYLQDDLHFEGTLQELSTTGGLYHVKVDGNEKLQTVDIHTEVELQCRLPGQDNIHRFEGHIKNIQKNSFDIHLGIVFSEPLTFLANHLEQTSNNKAIQSHFPRL